MQHFELQYCTVQYSARAEKRDVGNQAIMIFQVLFHFLNKVAEVFLNKCFLFEILHIEKALNLQCKKTKNLEGMGYPGLEEQI